MSRFIAFPALRMGNGDVPDASAFTNHNFRLLTHSPPDQNSSWLLRLNVGFCIPVIPTDWKGN
jgi:hypothetical protein